MAEVPQLDGLLADLAEGHRERFPEVFRLLWGPTQRLCARVMGNDADGADAAQTAMLKILERASEYDRRRPALPWALAIATFECRTLLRRRERRRETDDAPPETDGGQAVSAQEQALLVDAAMTAMGTLSAADQETLVATYWDTAASASGATLRKRRERALTRLRDAFRRLYGLD